MSQIILLLAAVTTLDWVGGQPFPYEMVIEFHQYSNPSHKLISGDCCDDSNCTDDCNGTLQLCYNRTSQSNFSCFPLGSTGGDYVNFTDTIGDQENPVVLRASILPDSGYQLLIESEISTNSFAFSLIDQTFVSIPASALGYYSHPQDYSGEILSSSTSPVTINLNYSLGCSPNYTLCNVDNVTQCVHEYECINGSASVCIPMTKTMLTVTLAAEAPSDGYSSSKCITTGNATSTFTSDYTPKTATSTIGTSSTMVNTFTTGAPSTINVTLTTVPPSTMDSTSVAGTPSTMSTTSTMDVPSTMDTTSATGTPSTMVNTTGAPSTIDVTSTTVLPSTMDSTFVAGTPSTMSTTSATDVPSTMDATSTTVSPSTMDTTSATGAPSTMDVTSTTVSSSPIGTTSTPSSLTNATDAGGDLVVAIAGASLGVLVLVAFIVFLVVVGVAVFLHGKKKKSGQTASTPSNMEVREEDGNGRQGSAYDSVEPNLDTEKAANDRGNSMQPNTTQPKITLPVYAVVERHRHGKSGSTEIELPNPMYDDTAIQKNEQPEYQETQRDVKNALYSSTTQQDDQPKYQETQRDVKNALYSSTTQQDDQDDQPKYQETQKEVKNILYA